MLLSSKVFAGYAVFDYKYSDWSTKYPSGLSEIFIESEVRYKWYKFENGKINYINEYHTSYDGYEKDMSSARTYYRYITNDKVVVDYKNDLVKDETYCRQNYCYLKNAGEVTLVETVLPSDATNKGVTWAASGNGIVSVDEGLVTALAQNRTLKSSVILGCCSSFDVVFREVTTADTYVNADGIEQNYANDGVIIDVVKYVLTPQATKLVSKYGANNVFNTLASDALAML